MRVLYRDPADETLAVAEITSTSFFPEEGVLQFSGDTDFAIRADKTSAEKVVRSLYLEGRVDVSGYQSCEIEMEFEDEEFEEDLEDELNDALEDYFSSEDSEGFRLPHRIAFPRRDRD